MVQYGNTKLIKITLFLTITSFLVQGAKVTSSVSSSSSSSTITRSKRADIRATPSAVVIPGFVKLAHKVSSGTVTLKDKRTISIENFNYDGAGPDAYFLVGKGATPNSLGRKIPNELGTYDVLSGYEGQDIELTLPADLTWNDVDYLSVYCISFRHNFGHVQIPKNLALPEYQP